VSFPSQDRWYACKVVRLNIVHDRKAPSYMGCAYHVQIQRYLLATPTDADQTGQLCVEGYSHIPSCFESLHFHLKTAVLARVFGCFLWSLPKAWWCCLSLWCRNLFRRLDILPFVSQYILLLILFVVKNKILFILNPENHTKGTQQSNNFYQPITNSTVYQKEYITWALRFLTIFLHTLKIYLIMSGNLKFT